MQTLLKDFSHYKATCDGNSKVFIFGVNWRFFALKKRRKLVCFIDDPRKQEKNSK